MKTFLTIAQIIVSVLLVASILIQSSRGAGLGMAFGGGSAVYRTKRGIEKIIFRATIVLAVVFLLISAAQLFVK